MPIIRITTNAPAEARDRVAAAIAEELGALGMIESHIATLFQEASTDDLYEGRRTLTESAGPVGFALVQVGMTAARPDDVRSRIAASIAAAFSPDVEADRVSTDFVAREAHDVYVGPQAMGRRPGRSADTGEPIARVEAPTAPISEAKVRDALFVLDWQPEVLSAPGDTCLESLRPAWMTNWSSLMAISTAEGLEEELDLAGRTLERGQADFARAFGANATIADLATYVAERAEAAT